MPRHDDDPRSKPVAPAWSTAISAWCAHLAAGGQSAPTIATRRDHLARASRALGSDPWSIDHESLVGWVAERDWSRETRRSVYASLRGFWRWATASGRASADPTSGLPRVRAAEPRPRPAPARVIRESMTLADPRTRMILRLAHDLGMRRAEIAQVHAVDLFEDLDGWSMTVHGKGGKERTLPLTDDLARAVRQMAAGDWLLPSDRDPSGHLSPRWVGKLATMALPGAWTLHTLRHACATEVHSDTHDLLVVQQLLGHASVATTQRYVQVPRDALRAAVVAHAA